MEGRLLWRAGDYLLQPEWVETDGRQERVGGAEGQPSVLTLFFTTVPGVGSCLYKPGLAKA